MEVIKNFKIDSVPVWKILFAATSMPDYEMDRIYIVEYNVTEYLLIVGYHCSCYEFDDTNWDATAYTKDELLKVLNGWKKGHQETENSIADLAFNYINAS